MVMLYLSFYLHKRGNDDFYRWDFVVSPATTMFEWVTVCVMKRHKIDYIPLAWRFIAITYTTASSSGSHGDLLVSHTLGSILVLAYTDEARLGWPAVLQTISCSHFFMEMFHRPQKPLQDVYNSCMWL